MKFEKQASSRNLGKAKEEQTGIGQLDTVRNEIREIGVIEGFRNKTEEGGSTFLSWRM